MPPKPFKPPRPVGLARGSSLSKAGTASVGASVPTVPKAAANQDDEDAAIFDLDSSPLEVLENVASTTRGSVKPTAISTLAQDDSEEEVDHDKVTAPQQPVSSAQGRIYIPPKLVIRLLHDKFKHDETRITKEAMAAVQIYIETFAKEAVARADEERKQAGGAATGGFLEVEHLEKLYPQLLLDF